MSIRKVNGRKRIPRQAQLTAEQVRDLQERECPKCRGIYWRRTTQRKWISQFLSPDGQEHEVYVDHWACDSCGWVDNGLEPQKSGYCATLKSEDKQGNTIQ